jgi:cytochrome c oxidase assembly protein subunit 11
MVSIKQKNKRLVWRLLFGVVFMFAFCYMMVPLYTLICNHLGINGRGDFYVRDVDSHVKEDTSREIKVDFSTEVHGDIPFTFKPVQYHVTIHPGEKKLIYFYAENTTGHPITIQAIPSITPDESAKYLKKTQCFCFTQQYFAAGEKADMPVYFYIEPTLPKNIKEVTLSYTLFDATKYIKSQKHYTEGRIDL